MPTPAPMLGVLDAWCRAHLGSALSEQFFGVQRISSVHGVRLADGREVALKVRAGEPRQAACRAVQAQLWRAGLACPQPLAGPLPLAEDPGIVVEGQEGDLQAAALAVNAETWEGGGTVAIGPGGARAWGQLAAGIVAAAPVSDRLAAALAPLPPWLGWDHDDPRRTWPPTSSHRWDPHRLDRQIDPVVHQVAARARARLRRADVATLPIAVGHGDLEAQNCRWVGEPPAARLVVHDWDSVVAASEAVIAGNTALSFAAVADDAIATIEQTEEVLAAYAAQRHHQWSALEQEVAWATGAWVAAYNAAFEHLKGGPGPVTAALRDQADERLARAGA